MTAQISPNRMEVSDRFPMLGFAVRTDRPDVEAEVVIANDIGLFSPQNRAARTAANFYTSREHGTLTVPRGDGVFVVPPEVLARFIGSEKLYFGLATGRSSNGGLQVDALPREGSPYVSLRGFTGRTLRRGFGSARPTAPKLDWTGDQARPGSESANGATAGGSNVGNGHAGNGSAGQAGSGNGDGNPGGPVYDDGFGPMPEIPARESSYSGGQRASRGQVVSGRPFVSAHAMGLPRGSTAITLSGGTTAQRALAWIREKVEQVVDAVGDDVNPPSLYRLGSDSGTFVDAWETVLGAASWIPGAGGTYAFLKAIPGLARSTGVTLSIGPALDTPLFGGGVGVVFAPDGQVALFGQGDISVDFEGMSEFITSLKAALQAKLKLGYNNRGLDGFASLAKVASVAVGEEIVVGAEVWLDNTGRGLGGAVSVGVGFALQLSVDDPRQKHGVPFVAAQQLGLPASRTAITLSSGTTPQRALNWIRERVEDIVGAVGDDVNPPALHRLGSDSSTFISAWETVLGAASWLPGGSIYGFLKEVPALARSTGITLSIGPALDTPLFGGGIGVVFAPDGQVALFGQGDISVDFDGLSEFVTSLKAALQAKLKFGYNNRGIDGFASLAKVASLAVGEEIVVGAEIWLDGQGTGLGGAVSIGVGFALQLSEQEASGSTQPAVVMPQLPGDARQRAQRIGGEFAPRIGEALDLGLDPASIAGLLDTLDPPQTAQPLAGARAMGTPTWSVHWDGVDLVPQPNGNACWASALSMIMGWRDQVSYAPSSIAQQCGRSITSRLPWSQRQAAATALGLGTVAPQCYTPEGFRDLIEAHGPLYVGKIMSDQINAGHAVVVTGMYFDGTDHFVRVADPWDRGAGSPGAPDPYSATHSTGSRYIMRFDTFMQEYEMAAAGTPAYVQIIYPGVPAGRTINTSTTAPSGYAMAAGAGGPNLPAPPPRQTRAMDAATIAGIAVDVITNSVGDIRTNLANWSGVKHPNDVAPRNPGRFEQGEIDLRDWPMIGGTFGLDDIFCWLKIRWQFNGTSLGRIYITENGREDAAGWGLTVNATIEDDSRLYARSSQARAPGPRQVPALHVNIEYIFDEIIADDHIANTRVSLYADGTYEISSRWVQHARPGGGTPTTVARPLEHA